MHKILPLFGGGEGAGFSHQVNARFCIFSIFVIQELLS